MDIGLFGGTFNPFHNGHINIIQHVKKTYGLARIFLIPSSTPPHKSDFNLAPATDRFDMVKQSIQGHDGLFVSDKELVRKGPSFTIDTINAFKEEFGQKARFFLLMGSDAFLDITTWKRKDHIFNAVSTIVMLRGVWKNIHAFASFIDENISKGYIFNEQGHFFSHKTKENIIICKVPKIDISSTMIRDRVKHHLSITGLVPESVEKIIYAKEL